MRSGLFSTPLMHRPLRAGMFGLLAMASTWMAQAATVVQSTPQGEVAQVRQVVVRFDRAVVPLGDLRQAAP